LIAEAMADDPGLEVVGLAAKGKSALATSLADC